MPHGWCVQEGRVVERADSILDSDWLPTSACFFYFAIMLPLADSTFSLCPSLSNVLKIFFRIVVLRPIWILSSTSLGVRSTQTLLPGLGPLREIRQTFWRKPPLHPGVSPERLDDAESAGQICQDRRRYLFRSCTILSPDREFCTTSWECLLNRHITHSKMHTTSRFFETTNTVCDND